MSTPPDRPAPAATDAETFEEMVFALAQHDQPTVAFVECGSLGKRNELEARLRERLPEYQPYTIDVTPYPVVSLLRTLDEQLPAEVRESAPVTYMVHVHGLENSLLVSQDGRLVPSLMTAQLNLERELLFRGVPYIIVLWGDAHFFRTLQREAPDLWHWVTYHFRFEDPEARASHEMPPLPPEPLRQKGNIAERQERIKELEERYERMKLDDSDKKRLLKDKISVLSLLGQEYSEAFAFAKAAKVYQDAVALQDILHIKGSDRGKLLFELGTVYMVQRRYSEALSCLEKSKEFALGDNIGAVLHLIGLVLERQRQWTAALENYHQALECYRGTGNQFESGRIYHQIGRVHEQQRQWAAALEYYQLALELYQRTGNEFASGSTYHQIGMVYEQRRQWAAALENYQLALECKQRTSNEFALCSTYHHIGIVHAEQRQWVAALKNYQIALEWCQRTGNEFELGGTYHQIGMVYQQQRKWVVALRNYQLALDWKRRTGNEFALSSTYHQIGVVHEQRGQWADALESLQLAVKWKQRTGNEFALGITYHQIGMVHEEQQNFTEAYYWYSLAESNMLQYNHHNMNIVKKSISRIQDLVNERQDTGGQVE